MATDNAHDGLDGIEAPNAHATRYDTALSLLILFWVAGASVFFFVRFSFVFFEAYRETINAIFQGLMEA
ncbi:MAG: hypothetical protein L3K26_08835 [Candidatus Hydrogenedentes bacterium]|nr:hypothetical protein [Candidatus Hydrogenedentota bacterium]